MTNEKMISGTTESGFEFSLDPEALDDYELLEYLCDIDNGDVSKITVAANALLGDAQMKKLKEHLRNEKGRVSAKKMIEEITQIFQRSSVKNS